MANYPLDQLRALLKLQGTDSRIDAIQAALKRAAEGLDLVALRERVAAAEADVKSHAEGLAKLRSELKFQEQEVAAIRAEIGAQERKLYGGLVRNPKEAAQMQQHVASLRRRMGELDDHALSLMLELESVEPAVVAAREQAGALKRQLVDGELRLAGEVRTLDEELPRLAQQRASLAAGLPAVLLKEYETLRPRRGGTAVVALADGKCSGCRMAVPYVMARDIRAGALRTCDTCGRIVVEPE